MAKIASALEIGPKYYQLFGYDALIFDDGVHFVTQFCHTNYNDSTKNKIE